MRPLLLRKFFNLMSINYKDWETKTVKVGSLFLDPENPRIPPGLNLAGEPRLIEELTVHDDVQSLARNIVDNGFFPSEPLVCIKESGKILVVEGNRRLAACKLLANPNLAPSDLIRRFRAMSANFDIDLLQRIPVVIAPTRVATVPLIIARHTATQVAKWRPAMQAHFYNNLLKHGATLEEVGRRFGLPSADIRHALHSHNLYQMACRLGLPDEAQKVVNDPREFNLTTLGRVFDTPHAREFFGIKFLDDGRISGSIPQEEFKKGFSKVVSDIALEKKDSRSLDTAANIKKYLASFSTSEKPDQKKKGSFDSETFLAPQTIAKPVPPSKPKNATPRGPSVGIIPKKFQCNCSNKKVLDLCEELQCLSPAKFKNSCAFTFRSFLEMSVYCYLDSKGEIARMQATYVAEIQRKNNGKPADKQRKPEANWTPNLSAMLSRIADPQYSLLKNAHTAKALNKVINEEGELFGLNLSTHNTTYHPSEARLRSTWANLEEFFKEILA